MLSFYQSVSTINVFETSHCQDLSTQLWSGRYFAVAQQETSADEALLIQLPEDGYQGYIPASILDNSNQVIRISELPPGRSPLNRSQIEAKLPQVLSYAASMLEQPNQYQWGGTVGPNLDCSGLVQRSFASAGIWLPRDAYQQADFCQPLWSGSANDHKIAKMTVGDLLFFQHGQRRIDHVAIYFGDGQFLHSSGTERGRNGIAWDSLQASTSDDAIAIDYRQHICRAGRISQSLAFPL